ncbi:MAG: flavin reductase (DIM6/NTAB) family NADH-FMN oxidoreductase RutF [Alteromonas macleodii]|jgi:flavin reductase (DIM6/NTAB) family NADH-FMN oxidoreductase RutF
MHYTENEVLAMDRIYRLNLINSITGIKPGNLVGTKSADGKSNLAIISSVVHLGSNPALLGFLMRPQQAVQRHTYGNILETGTYTINHIPNHLTKQAHYTSAKFEKNVSEFDACGFTEEYMGEFTAPFVGESETKVAMRFVEEVPITANNTIFIIGSIEHVIISDIALSDDGSINLEAANSVGISGLDSYYKLNKIAAYPHATLDNIPKLG